MPTKTKSPEEKGRFLCDCGRKTETIRIHNGKKTCDDCTPRNLSGAFLRRLETENTYYARDILQPYDKSGNRNPEYIETYGTKVYEKNSPKGGR